MTNHKLLQPDLAIKSRINKEGNNLERELIPSRHREHIASIQCTMVASLCHLVHSSRHLSRVHPSLLQKSCTRNCRGATTSYQQISKRSTSNITSTTKSDYFPWQHSPSLPDRVNDSDDLSGMPNNMRARFVRRMIAGRELNLKFWDIVPLGFEREWEEELAANFSTGWCIC